MSFFKKNQFILLTLTVVGLCCSIACKNDPAGKKVTTIQADGSTGGGIIKNPASASAPLDTANMPKIKYDHIEFDYGKVKEGKIVEHSFPFKNVGNRPLLIATAEANCGCTASDYPKDPIMPGQKSQIKIKFNSEGRKGGQAKWINVTANTYPAQSKVMITGEVIPK